MLHLFGWATLIVLGTYLALFFWGGLLAAQSSGRAVWLFNRATGTVAWAARGFRVAFASAFFGPLLWLAVPSLHKADPLWAEGAQLASGFAGLLLSIVGSMLAFAAQMSMGDSWRVGVQMGESGPMVQGGLFRFSRNPTFLGQLLLLAGVALAIPAAPTTLAAFLFFVSAQTQIRTEERVLSVANGEAYANYCRTVPRWLGSSGRRPL